MKVEIEKTKEFKELEFRGTIAKLLKELNINPEEVIVSVNGSLATLDSEVENKDEVRVLSVISGG